MIGPGPFVGGYESDIRDMRMSRLDNDRQEQIRSMVAKLEDPKVGKKDVILRRFGELIRLADSFDPLPPQTPAEVNVSYDIFSGVWFEASQIRSSGELLQMGKDIKCPVVVLHGDYDPHVPEGIEGPLASVLKDLRFIVLENCGHRPWEERQARERFFEYLHKYI